MHRQPWILIDLLVAGQTGFTNRFSAAAGTLYEILKSRLKFLAQNASQSRAQPVKNTWRSKPFFNQLNFLKFGSKEQSGSGRCFSGAQFLPKIVAWGSPRPLLRGPETPVCTAE
jgi:hypothetical protein